jgi:isopenicillin N synthase-like dioxygenase
VHLHFLIVGQPETAETWGMSAAISYNETAAAVIANGYALLHDPSVLLPYTLSAFVEGEAFFAQSDATKLTALSPALLEGYRPFGAEYSETPDRPDLCEFFAVWPWNQGLPEVDEWASGCPLQRAMSDALPTFAAVANGLIEALRHQLNANAPTMEVSLASYLQMNHYRPRDFDEELLQDSHEDGHILTILKSTHPGLEILVGEAFIPILLPDDAFMVLPGSMMTLITGGRIAPLYHRVRNDHATASRQTLIHFVNPSTTAETEPWIESAENRNVSIRELALSCIGAR